MATCHQNHTVHQYFPTMDHAKAEYIAAQAALKIEIESSLAKYLAAAKDGSNADEKAILREALDFWRGRLSTLEDAWAARNIVAAAPTQGKRQLPTPTFVVAPSSHVRRSLLVRSISRPLCPSLRALYFQICFVRRVVVCARGIGFAAGRARLLVLLESSRCGLYVRRSSLSVSNHPPPSASLSPPCPAAAAAPGKQPPSFHRSPPPRLVRRACCRLPARRHLPARRIFTNGDHRCRRRRRRV